MTMAANEIRRIKIKLLKILGANFNHILDCVHQESLITDREFGELNDQKDIKSLIDRIMGKGEDTCKRFLDLLQSTDEVMNIQGTFPDLKTIQLGDPLKRALDDPKDQNHGGPVQSKRHKGDDQDKLTSTPTSFCLNIHNINIKSPRQRQRENFRPVHSDNTPKKMRPRDGIDDTVAGFIHCVTPIKTSMKETRAKYFNAVLQTGPDQFRHTAIFDPEKHTAFTQAQIKSTAVKLSRINKKTEGFDRPDDFEVEVSWTSVMVETTVPFQPQQPPDSSKMKIVDVLKLKQKTKIGKLDAHVISKDPIKMVNKRGERYEVKECLIRDSSGQIRLQLWGDLIKDVKINTSYEFSNISTRQKPGETQLYLTSRKETSITTIDKLFNHLTVEPVDRNLISISGVISAIDLTSKHRCVRVCCGKSQMVSQNAYIKCVGCRHTQPVESFILDVSGTIDITTSTGKVHLTVPPSVLRAYLTSCSLLGLLNNTDKLELHFLAHKYFKVCHSAGHEVDSLEKVKKRA